MKRKSVEERLEDAKGLRLQLSTWLSQADMGIADVPELKDFVNDMNVFIRDAVSITRTIRVPYLKRICIYRFSVQPHVKSSMDLLYRPALFEKTGASVVEELLDAIDESTPTKSERTTIRRQPL